MGQDIDRTIRMDFIDARDFKAETVIKAAAAQPNKVIVDGGAAMGVYTQELLDLGYEGIVYCFEPFPRNNRLFREKIGWPPNVV